MGQVHIVKPTITAHRLSTRRPYTSLQATPSLQIKTARRPFFHRPLCNPEQTAPFLERGCRGSRCRPFPFTPCTLNKKAEYALWWGGKNTKKCVLKSFYFSFMSSAEWETLTTVLVTTSALLLHWWYLGLLSLTLCGKFLPPSPADGHGSLSVGWSKSFTRPKAGTFLMRGPFTTVPHKNKNISLLLLTCNFATAISYKYWVFWRP